VVRNITALGTARRLLGPYGGLLRSAKSANDRIAKITEIRLDLTPAPVLGVDAALSRVSPCEPLR